MRNVHDIILEKIQKGEVHMIPRWRFVLTGAFWVFGLVVASLLAVYLASFVLFVVHRSGLLFIPGFGWRGVMMFVVMSPWMLIVATAIFLGIVYLLVRQYAFSYKKPMVYSLIGIVLGVLTLSLAIHLMAIQARIHDYTQQHNVPGVSGMYQSITSAHAEKIFVGKIIETQGSKFILQTKQRGNVLIQVTSNTRKSPSLSLAPGEIVFVLGDMVTTGEVVARGVRRVPPEFFENRAPYFSPAATDAL